MYTYISEIDAQNGPKVMVLRRKKEQGGWERGGGRGNGGSCGRERGIVQSVVHDTSCVCTCVRVCECISTLTRRTDETSFGTGMGVRRASWMADKRRQLFPDITDGPPPMVWGLYQPLIAMLVDVSQDTTPIYTCP